MKYVIGLFLLFAVPCFSETATFFAQNCVTDSQTAGNVWLNVNFASGTCDGLYANSSLSGDRSEYLLCWDFNFRSIIGPFDRINGSSVTWGQNRTGLFSRTVVDNSVKMVKKGIIAGSDKADALTDWRDKPIASYGSSADLWGTSWTGADVISSSFGVVKSGYNDGIPGSDAQIDCVSVTLDYTPRRTVIINGKIF